MWRFKQKATSGLAALLLLGMAGCVDLEVQNPNAPDAERVFETAKDVESLIAGAWANIYRVGASYSGPSLLLSNASGQHVAPWSNAGMEVWGRIPRQPTGNAPGTRDGNRFINPWVWSYRAISAVRTGFQSMDEGATDLGADETRARAYGKFAQGVAHGALAMLYDSAFVYDEAKELEDLVLLPYGDVLTAALGYLDDAIALASGATFTLPSNWMSVDVTASELVDLAYSFKAQLRASVGRTPAERAAVDWNAVASDAANGVTEDWMMNIDWIAPWNDADAWWAGAFSGWSMMQNWYLGMADTSGTYQTWVVASTTGWAPGDTDKKGPIYIFTPDTRFPQGGNATMTAADIETAQVAAPGVNTSQWGTGQRMIMNQGSARIHSRPDRGSWRWGYYDLDRWLDWANGDGPYTFVSAGDLHFLRAEAAFRSGDLATAATMINATRTLAGLNATNAAGLNTSCVPKLPDGSCGDLWEMLKWEKRLTTNWIGLFSQGYYYDGRGWGDLVEGTLLHFPVPYTDYQILEGTPYDFGGAGGNAAAALGTYGFKDIP